MVIWKPFMLAAQALATGKPVDRWLATANPQAAQGQQHLCHSPVALTANGF